MIWWLYRHLPRRALPFTVIPEIDGAWLGECAWTAATDNMGLGLR